MYDLENISLPMGNLCFVVHTIVNRVNPPLGAPSIARVAIERFRKCVTLQSIEGDTRPHAEWIQTRSEFRVPFGIAEDLVNLNRVSYLRTFWWMRLMSRFRFRQLSIINSAKRMAITALFREYIIHYTLLGTMSNRHWKPYVKQG